MSGRSWHAIMHERHDVSKDEMVAFEYGIHRLTSSIHVMMPTSRSGFRGQQQNEDKIIKIRSVRSECTRDIKRYTVHLLFFQASNTQFYRSRVGQMFRRKWGC